MGILDFFKKRTKSSESNLEWFNVASQLSGTLWTVLHEHPEMLANPYVRVVLRDDWNVGIACDERTVDKLLSPGETSFVFLREDMAAFKKWIEGLRAIPDPFFQQAETEEFAKLLTKKLAERVEVLD